MRAVINAKSAHIAKKEAIDGLFVELEMTEGQMYQALMNFLDHVTDETWTKWQRQINEEIYGMEVPA